MAAKKEKNAPDAKITDKEGKEKGFTPVFLVLDDVLLEKFKKLADGLYKNIQWYFWWD